MNLNALRDFLITSDSVAVACLFGSLYILLMFLSFALIARISILAKNFENTDQGTVKRAALISVAWGIVIAADKMYYYWILFNN